MHWYDVKEVSRLQLWFTFGLLIFVLQIVLVFRILAVNIQSFSYENVCFVHVGMEMCWIVKFVLYMVGCQVVTLLCLEHISYRSCEGITQV